MNESRSSLAHQATAQGLAGAWTDAIGAEIIPHSNQDQVEPPWLLQMLVWERRRLTALNETLEHQLERRTAQVQALASALSKAEQQERKQIAQLLHDDLQQLLYGQGVRLKTLRWQLTTEGTAVTVEQIEQMLELIDQAIRVTRTLAIELNPPGLESEDLTGALQWLSGHMQEAYGLDVQLTCRASGQGIDPKTQSLLVQMVRELLFNVVKHAGTDQAAIEVRQEDGRLIVTITDKGQGFELEATRARQARRGSFGLFSIEERLNLVGGRLEIDSSPGRGTRILLSIPAK